MANEAAVRFTYRLPRAEIDFLNDTFKVILMQSGFTFDRDNHHGYADVSASELAAGFGYTAGGATLAGVAVTENDANDRTNITWNDPTWTAGPGGDIGPTCGAIIYDDTEANDSIIGFIDFGADYTQADGGTMTLVDVGVRVNSIYT